MSKKATQETKKGFSWQKLWRDIRMIIIIIPLALLLKSNTVELFKIPTGSMEPTLYGAEDLGRGFGDHILVLRYRYGFNTRIKVPLINWVVPIPEWRWMAPGTRPPLRGEVVVFENPMNPHMDYIKRCVAVGGDRVTIRDGLLYVNDAPQTNTPAQATYVHYTHTGILGDRFVTVRDAIEHIRHVRPDHPVASYVRINGRPYQEVARAVADRRADFDPVRDTIQTEILVPEDSFFMLGDNSAFSYDGRNFGFVPMRLVKGKAWAVYLPIKRIRVVR